MIVDLESVYMILCVCVCVCVCVSLHKHMHACACLYIQVHLKKKTFVNCRLIYCLFVTCHDKINMHCRAIT